VNIWLMKKILLEEERKELMAFDKDLILKWGEVVCEQGKEMERLGVPYFGSEGEEENREKMLAFLEDFVADEKQK
jgi:hypothetical protein